MNFCLKMPNSPRWLNSTKSKFVTFAERRRVLRLARRTRRQQAARPRLVRGALTELLPPELSSYTPADPGDLWAGPGVVAIGTGAGSGGFLTGGGVPSQYVYESRST